MTCSFRVYVDESGDEGFQFLPDERGSSRWFVLSAAVVRRHRDLELVGIAKRARELLGKPQKMPLHFRNLRHEQRVPFARLIGTAALRHIHVMIHKPSIKAREVFQREKFSLYRCATRLLLERVSWLCRDCAVEGYGNGKAELIFSNRSAMSYEALSAYLRLLEQRNHCRIHWPSLDLRHVRAVNHDQLAGLQIADAIATSAFYAVHRNIYGETEGRYLHLLRRNVYRSNGRLDGYGVKLWCHDTDQCRRVIAALTGDRPSAVAWR